MKSVDYHSNEKPENRRFYKYMTRSTGKIVLENRTLRWSTPRTLNDPYDIQFDLNLDLDRNIVKELAAEKSWNAYSNPDQALVGNQLGDAIKLLQIHVPNMSREEYENGFSDDVDESLKILMRNLPKMNEELRTFLRPTKILCLSEISDDTKMWTHYGENHQGIVISFKCAVGIDSPWPVGKRVNYVESMPTFMDEELLSEILSGRASMDAELIVDQMVYTKSMDWSYEREWRICTGDGRHPDADFEDVQFNSRELDEVIFGCNCPTNNREEIQQIVQHLYPQAQLFRMVKDSQQFKLLKVPFSALT